MSFIKSILLGGPGSYLFCGINVKFKDKEIILGEPVENLSTISLIAKKCFELMDGVVEKSVFQLLTLSNLHVFVHELGHSIANKLFTGESIKRRFQPKSSGAFFSPRSFSRTTVCKKRQRKSSESGTRVQGLCQ